MAMSDTLSAGSTGASWRDYLTLTKPRVVAVLVLTSMVGMLLASPVLPSVDLFILANLGIGLAASAAAVVNHVVDRRIDAMMSRTKHRPVCDGKVSASNALLFSFVLGTSGLSMLIIVANPLTALLDLRLDYWLCRNLYLVPETSDASKYRYWWYRRSLAAIVRMGRCHRHNRPSRVATGGNYFCLDASPFLGAVHR